MSSVGDWFLAAKATTSAPIDVEQQQHAGEPQHVDQAASSAPTASSTRRPGGELRTGLVLLLGCGAPIAGCLPAARGHDSGSSACSMRPFFFLPWRETALERITTEGDALAEGVPSAPPPAPATAPASAPASSSPHLPSSSMPTSPLPRAGLREPAQANPLRGGRRRHLRWHRGAPRRAAFPSAPPWPPPPRADAGCGNHAARPPLPPPAMPSLAR
ncbi:uncharacterized protein [Miscanthus floridulus]|uniref:uncharacterized protein n=1 Tax=Miscanthus floridulus TaxID=154761 RepID=UPI003459D2A5